MSYFNRALTVIAMILVFTSCDSGSELLTSDLPGFGGTDREPPAGPKNTGTTEEAIGELPKISDLNFGPALTHEDRETLTQTVHDRLTVLTSDATTMDAMETSDKAVFLKSELEKIPGVAKVTLSASNNLTISLSDGTPYFYFLKPKAPTVTGQWIRKLKKNSVSLVKNVAGSVSIFESAHSIPIPGTHTHAEFPTSSKATLVNVLGLGGDAASVLQTALTTKGYAVTTSTGTLPQLRTVFKQISIGWISTHGGEVDVPVSRNPGEESKISLMGVGTGDAITGPCSTRPDCAQVRQDMDEMRIAKGGYEGQPVPYFIMTRGFFRKYFAFESRSMLFLDGCSTGAPDKGSADIRSDLKSVSNLGHLLAWDKTVWNAGATMAAKYVFDRMAGTNQFEVPDIKLRPFSLGEVFDWMKRTNRDEDAYGTSRLIYFKNSSEDLMLAPSIWVSHVTESDKKLTVYGDFGSDTPTATIGGNPVTVRTPGQDQIELTIDDQDQGDVIITSKGHDSNKAPLTAWEGTMKQSQPQSQFYGAPGIVLTVNCSKLRFRTDIHPWRTKIDELAKSGPARDNISEISDATQNINCSWTATGYGVNGDLKTTIKSGSTAGTLNWMHNEDEKPYGYPWVFFLGHVDSVSKTIRFVLNYSFIVKLKMQSKSYSMDTETAPFFNSGFNAPATLRNPGYALDANFGMPSSTDVGVDVKGPMMDPGKDGLQFACARYSRT